MWYGLRRRDILEMTDGERERERQMPGCVSPHHEIQLNSITQLWLVSMNTQPINLCIYAHLNFKFGPSHFQSGQYTQGQQKSLVWYFIWLKHAVTKKPWILYTLMWHDIFVCGCFKKNLLWKLLDVLDKILLMLAGIKTGLNLIRCLSEWYLTN